MSITPLRPRTGPNSPDGSPVRLVTPGAQDAAGMLDDNALFRAVVMPHIDEAYRLARWLTSNGTDAEDVVQDASLRAFRAIRGYAGGNPRAWLLSIVRNTAYSWMRKNRPATIVSVDDLEAVEIEHAASDESRDDTPEASLIAKIAAKKVVSHRLSCRGGRHAWVRSVAGCRSGHRNSQRSDVQVVLHTPQLGGNAAGRRPAVQ